MAFSDCVVPSMDGTLTNGPAWTLGRENIRTGLKFGGDATTQYVTMGAASYLNLTGDMSFAGWVKLNSDYTTRQCFCAHSTAGSGAATAYALTFGLTDNKFEMQIDPSAGPQITATRSISDNDWHHYAATRWGSAGSWNLALYIDGVPEGTAISAANATSSTVFSIGRFGGFAPNYYLNGTTDDFRIYNRALSAAEVTQLAAPSFLPVLPGARRVDALVAAGGSIVPIVDTQFRRRR